MCMHTRAHVMIQMKQADSKKYEQTQNFCIREIIKT